MQRNGKRHTCLEVHVTETQSPSSTVIGRGWAFAEMGTWGYNDDSYAVVTYAVKGRERAFWFVFTYYFQLRVAKKCYAYTSDTQQLLKDHFRLTRSTQPMGGNLLFP